MVGRGVDLHATDLGRNGPFGADVKPGRPALGMTGRQRHGTAAAALIAEAIVPTRTVQVVPVLILADPAPELRVERLRADQAAVGGQQNKQQGDLYGFHHGFPSEVCTVVRGDGCIDF